MKLVWRTEVWRHRFLPLLPQETLGVTFRWHPGVLSSLRDICNYVTTDLGKIFMTVSGGDQKWENLFPTDVQLKIPPSCLCWVME